MIGSTFLTLKNCVSLTKFYLTTLEPAKFALVYGKFSFHWHREYMLFSQCICRHLGHSESQHSQHLKKVFDIESTSRRTLSLQFVSHFP